MSGIIREDCILCWDKNRIDSDTRCIQGVDLPVTPDITNRMFLERVEEISSSAVIEFPSDDDIIILPIYHKVMMYKTIFLGVCMISQYEYYKADDHRMIAYRKVDANGSDLNTPGFIYLGGYRSDMTGSKSTWLFNRAVQHGHSCLLFDYTGHGNSSGDFNALCISDWLRDSVDIINSKVRGRHILVGSSMGGWLSLLLARMMPEKIAAIICIAPAPDFTSAIYKDLSDDKKQRLKRMETLYEGNPDWPIVLTEEFILDGEKNSILSSPCRVSCPVRIVIGDSDHLISVEDTLKLLRHLEGDDISMYVMKHADHSFSTPACLEVLDNTINGLSSIS